MKLYKRILEFDVGGKRKRQILKQARALGVINSSDSILALQIVLYRLPVNKFWVRARNAAWRKQKIGLI